MINIDTSLFIQVANFLFLMIVLNFLLYRPLRQVIRQRREKFDGFEKDIKGLSGQADATVQEIDARLAEAKREGFLKRDEIKGQGLEEEKRIIAAASGDAEASLTQIKAQISGEIVTARDALKADLELFSRELAQKVLGRSLS